MADHIINEAKLSSIRMNLLKLENVFQNFEEMMDENTISSNDRSMIDALKNVLNKMKLLNRSIHEVVN